MTWRERIQAARERGGFTEEDRALANAFPTCLVGETCMRMADAPLWRIDGVLEGFGTVPHYAPPNQGPIYWVEFNYYDQLDDLLDRIEDRVLQIQLEMAP